MTTVLLDINNLFSRCKYAIKESDKDVFIPLVANSMFGMIREITNRFKPKNVVAFCDGKGSWRKLVYPQYKANRTQEGKTAKEIERDEMALTFLRESFVPFLKNDTCMPVVDGDLLEADDFIATYTYMFPDEGNIICSTDGDFIQLLTDTTCVYNSMEKRFITKNGLYDTDSGKLIHFETKDGKLKVSKELCFVQEGEQAVPSENWVEYSLFVKCIRGDKSDNILSAYPRVMEKTTKTNIGLKDAFESQKADGFAWNNLMKKTWKDMLGEGHIVEEEYNKNRLLIDLKMLPCDLRNNAITIINEQINKPKQPNAYKKLSLFLKKYGLQNLLDSIDSINQPYTVGYDGR